jgi:hypothetical protein
MRAAAKVGIVGVGYLLALVVAWGTVAAHVAMTSGQVAQASAGMYAAGDAILFLAVFAVASLPATGTAFFFLRPYPAFWRTLSFVAVVVASTAVVAAAGFLLGSRAAPGGVLAAVAMAAPLRVFLVPPFAALWLVAVPFAPDRRARYLLGISGLVEIGLVFVFFFTLFVLG